MKKSLILILIFCCLVISINGFSQDRCEDMFSSAMGYLNKGDYETALSMFNRVKDACGDYKGTSIKIKECEDRISKATIVVSPQDVFFGPQGGTETVNVVGVTSWSYGKTPDWLILTKYKGQLFIECEGNDTGEERSAGITISTGEGSGKTYKKIQVSQDKSTLRVSTRSIVVPESGLTYNVEVNSNDDWNVYAQDVWVTAKKTDGYIQINFDRNFSTLERRGKIKIMTLNKEVVEIEIIQAKAKPRLELESFLPVSGHAGSHILPVDSNAEWRAEVTKGGSWCKVRKQSDRELRIDVLDNDLDATREAEIKVSINNSNTFKIVTVTQRADGYMALYEDYFRQIEGTKRITKLSASLYLGGCNGLRVSAFMMRWKVVEIDLLNLNTSVSKTYHLSWEPMVRGYLPLQSNGRCWTAYLGVGRCVSFVDAPLRDNVNVNHSNALIELGAECKVRFMDRDNFSTRIFVRFDGFASLGVAMDLYEWK